MDSRYPNALDDDVTIIRVDDNIVEIGGDAINGLRSAVFNIEETLGINPQGSTNDVVTRLNRSLNADGSIKASALSSIGLVTLPITKEQIALNAGIEESKLHLDYSTTQLKLWIDEFNAIFHNYEGNLDDLIHNVTQHVANPSAWGRHHTSDIDGYDIDSGPDEYKYTHYNLQGIITDLDTRIVVHVGDAVGAHAASAISVDDTLFVYAAENVQEALDELNDLGQSLMVDHRENQHDNGILSTQNVNQQGYDHSYTVVSEELIFSAYAGNTKITFQNPPVGFGQILKGDRIDVKLNDVIYTYNVNRIDVGNNSVFFFGSLPVSGDGTATIYRNSEELSSPVALKAVIREQIQTSLSGVVIQIIHPSSPYIIGVGANPFILESGSTITLKWSNSEETISVYTLLSDFNSKPSTWTPQVCANVLNFYAVGVGIPVIFFESNNEIGIAYDKEEGYVEIGTSTNKAWEYLGFVEGEKAYSLGPRRFFVSGKECYGIKKKISSHGDFNGDNIAGIEENLNAIDVVASGIIRVESTNTSRTYNFNDNTAHTISSNLLGFSPGSVNFEIYSDSFGLRNPPGRRTLYELFVDAYGGHDVELRGSMRLEYSDTTILSPNNPSRWFNVKDVSRNFSEKQKRIYYDGNYNVTFGDRDINGLVTNVGNTVILPSINAEGFEFRLYDGSWIDYVDLEIVDSSYNQPTITANAIDVDVHDKISEDKYIQVATFLHNTQYVCYLNDRRSFGTVGRKTIRDDFKRDYISYPSSLLRGNGVVYGLSLSLVLA